MRLNGVYFRLHHKTVAVVGIGIGGDGFVTLRCGSDRRDLSNRRINPQTVIEWRTGIVGSEDAPVVIDRALSSGSRIVQNPVRGVVVFGKVSCADTY